MSLEDLIPYVSRALTDNQSVVVTDDDFRRITKLSEPMTRERANHAAWRIVHDRHHLVAAAETFVHAATLEPIRVYLICARSREAYQVRVAELRQQIEGELSADMVEHLEYLHNAAREPDGPAPLIIPKPVR